MNKLTVFKSSVKYSLTSIIILFIIANPERTQGQVLIQDFKNPPIEYRPIPFWHMNGTITTEGINQQVSDAINSGFGGVAVCITCYR